MTTHISGGKKGAEALRSRIVGEAMEPPESLLANPSNWRRHGKYQQQALEALLKNVGWVQRVIVNKRTGHIVDGHLRVEVALRRHEASVPVVYVDLSPEEEKVVLAAIDPIGALADTDQGMLNQLLANVVTGSADLDAFLATLVVKQAAGLTDPDAAPALEAEAVSQPGDVWLLGDHRLACGDSTVAGMVDRLLGGLKPLLMVTDPPYGVQYDANWRNDAPQAGVGERGAPSGRAVGKVMNDARMDWREAWALFPGNVAYVWHGGLHSTTVAESLIASKFGLRAQIVWVKTRQVISRGHYHWQHEPAWYAEREGLDVDMGIPISTEPAFEADHEVLEYAVRAAKTANWQGSRKQRCGSSSTSKARPATPPKSRSNA